MPSLKAKQLLFKAAKANKKKEKISKKEIEKKINQIKYLASKKKISKTSLKKEIINLEKQLQGIFLLEKKLKEKEEKESEDITALKKQIKDLKKRISSTKDVALRKKVEKLSHLIGDLMARDAVKNEVRFEKAKKKIEEKAAPEIMLKQIDEFKEKILALKKSGKYPVEKIFALEKRLTNLERKLPVKEVLGPQAAVKHKMLFGPQAEEVKLPEIRPEVERLEEEIDELPLPPPPRIRKKK